MAQGYIKLSEPSQCFEDIGREYFMDLMWRSFFQGVKKDELGNIKSCKMHDLMHDLASLVAGAESVHMLISNPREVTVKTRHISSDHLLNINRYNDPWQVPISVREAKSLRTFLAPEAFYDDLSCKIGEGQCRAIFCNLRRLRQLDLQKLGIETVPHSIGKLKHLRYLNMSWNTEIKMLPHSITRLQNLQVLKLENCRGLRRLPEDIKKLVSLRQLELFGCLALTHMPRGIGWLTSLERLTRFVLPESLKWKQESQSGGLGELRGLNNLGGKLQIVNLPHGNGKYNQKSNVAEMSAAANLREKPRLQWLGLEWVPLEDLDSNDDIVNEEMTLEALQPHPNLKSLSLLNYGGLKIASWLSSLTNLVSLQLYNCKKCQSLLALDQFTSLKEIFINGLTDLVYIDMESCVVSRGSAISSSCSSSMVSFFPSLEKLVVYECPNLKGWWPSSSSLPQFQRLSVLWISSCPKLTSMPPFPTLKELFIESATFKSLEQMLKATISAANTPSSIPSDPSPLRDLSIEKIEHLPEDFLALELLQILTSLKYLRIGYCPRLTCLPHTKMLHLISLEILEISDCEDLDLSIDDDDDDDDDNGSNSNNNSMLQQGLRSLAFLRIRSITKLVHLPRRLLLHSIVLQRLKISDCHNLVSLPEWMPNLTSLQYLEIKDCSQLLERCKNNKGEDWPKIAHIPNIKIEGTKIQWHGYY